MQLIEYRLRGRPGDKLNYYFIGDIHFGHVGCCHSTIKRDVKAAAADPFGRVILMGDILDAVAVTDKRWSFSSLDPECFHPIDEPGDRRQFTNGVINRQISMAYEYLKPLKGKIDAFLTGNHEETLVSKANFDPLEVLAEKLEFNNYKAAYNVGIRYTFEGYGKGDGKNTTNWVLDVAATHGSGGGRKSGGKVNRVEDTGLWLTSADIVAMGHVHKKNAGTQSILTFPRHKHFTVKEKEQWCILTGSYLRGYHVGSGSQYTERWGMQPTSIGGMMAEVTLTWGGHSVPAELKIKGYPI